MRRIFITILLLLTAIFSYAQNGTVSSTQNNSDLQLPSEIVVTDSTLIYYRRSLLFKEVGMFPGTESENDFARIVALNPDDPDSYLNRACFFWNPVFKNPEAVKPDLDKAIELAPCDAHLYFARALFYSLNGDEARASEDYEKAVGLAPDSPMAYYRRGCLKVDAGDGEGALKEFGKILDMVPDKELSSMGDLGHMIRVPEKVAEYDEYDKELYFWPDMMPADHSDLVFDHFRKSLGKKTGPDELLAQAYILRGYFRGGNEDDYRAAIGADFENADAYCFLGEVAGRCFDYETGWGLCNRASELDPDFAMAYYGRGAMMDKSRPGNDPIPDFDMAIKLGLERSFVYEERGYAKALRGDRDGAIMDFDRAVELDPSECCSYGAYIGRACTKAAKGDFAGALKDLEKSHFSGALEYIFRGMIYLETGDKVAARCEFERLYNVHYDNDPENYIALLSGDTDDPEIKKKQARAYKELAFYTLDPEKKAEYLSK